MAVQVSEVHLTGGDVDSEPLKGIKNFVRDILPYQCHPSSPDGGTTPTLQDQGFEESERDNSYLKRKSCRVEDESADSEQSDSEHLPSSKRQRITVSAMRRLFAKFTLNDTDETSQSAAPRHNRTTSEPSDETPQHSPYRPSSPGSEVGDNLNDTATHSDSPDRRLTVRSEKRISEGDAKEEYGEKRQRTSEKQSDSEEEKQETETNEQKEEQDQKKDAEKNNKITATTSDDASKKNKRQAETAESENEETSEQGNKVKRTRRLRRGLRLSTNITCYIEQILYN